MFRGLAPAAVVSLAMLIGCGSRQSHAVEGPVLRSLKGTRDGDVLRVRAVFGDDAQSLRVDLRFKVTPPTRLESGTWTGPAGEGTVRERSVTFLGGQSGPPSIGGKFELIGPGNQAVYRVIIPLQELKRPL